MSLFDDLLASVWKMARQNENFLAEFAKLEDDKKRIEKLLSVPEMRALKLANNFFGKSDDRAEEFRLKGDTNSAIKSASSSSQVLAHSYADRSRILLQSNKPELALKDAKRALEFALPLEDIVRIHCLTASCHYRIGLKKQAEEILDQALEKIKNSNLQNEIKAVLTKDIVQQLKMIREKKKHQEPKVIIL